MGTKLDAIEQNKNVLLDCINDILRESRYHVQTYNVRAVKIGRQSYRLNAP